MEATRLFLVGEVGYFWDNSDKMALFNASPEPLDVYIDSEGGSVTAGNSFAALLRAHADNYGVEVRTIGIGLVASIATSVLLAGTKAEMDEDCMMMIHNPSVDWFSGDAEKMRQTADTLDKLKSQLVDMYIRKITKSGKATEKTRKEIERMMDAETWLTAKEALDLGLIDSIQTFETEKEEAVNLMAALPNTQQAQYQTIVNKFKNNQSMPTPEDKDEVKVSKKGFLAKLAALFFNDAEATTEAVTTPAVVTPEAVIPAVKTIADMTDEELAAELESRKKPQQESEMQAKLKAMETEIAMLKAKAPVTVATTVAQTNESAINKALREKREAYFQNATVKAAIENTKFN